MESVRDMMMEGYYSTVKVAPFNEASLQETLDESNYFNRGNTAKPYIDAVSGPRKAATVPQLGGSGYAKASYGAHKPKATGVRRPGIDYSFTTGSNQRLVAHQLPTNNAFQPKHEEANPGA